MNSKVRYIQFPLFLLQDFLTNKVEVIDRIFGYGIYRYSKAISFKPDKAMSHFIYCYYNKRDVLTDYLLVSIDYYINNDLIELNEDYKGFDSEGKFNPEYEIEQLLKIVEKDIEFKENLIEFYKMHLSCQSLQIETNIGKSISIAKQIEQLTPQKEPLPMVNIDLLFEFRDNVKSEFELFQFLCFIAIKSIIGTKEYVKTNKKHIICRMFGYNTIKHLPKKFKVPYQSLFIKYSMRYHLDKLIRALELNWNVLTYSNNMRGFYVCVENKMSLEKLVLVAESQKQNNKIKTLKQDKTNAKNKALKHLGLI